MADSDLFLSALRFPQWQAQYEAALFETDRAKVLWCVAAAEAAILGRLDVLADKAGHEQERIAMTDALRALGYLKAPTA
jgi:hypothetical protein